jgi:tRNA (pseudouridine54-N1)-methyltransferase
MRTFVLFARQARTDANFNMEDLPSSGGRMDLVARCITASLWLSHAIRPDAKIYAVLNGPPDPPVTIIFDGSAVRKVSPDERSIALWIKKALSEEFGKDWHMFRPGILVARKSLQEIVRELKDRPIYVLHEKGKNIKEIDVKDNSVWLLGDHLGIPDKDEKFVLRYAEEKVSIGKQVHLASSCISIINWVCDNKDAKHLCVSRT